MNKYTSATASMDEADRDRSSENLSISSVQITGDSKLNITVRNLGSVQSRVLWIGLFNQSTTPEEQGFFSVSESISVGETQCFLSPFYVTSDQKYAVQLVTENGNVFDYYLSSGNKVKLDLSLIAAPPTVYQGNNITLLLTVTNNSTEGQAAENITVSLSAIPGTLTSSLTSPASLYIGSLAPGSSTFFTWTFGAQATGTVVFEATYNQAPAGAFATASVSILSAPSESQGGGQGQVLITGAASGYAIYNPSQWSTLSGTSYVSGTIPNVASNDGNSAVFRSYYSGNFASYNYFVNTAAAGTGTHSNFNAMKNGPDSTYDTLTEADIGGGFANTTLLEDGFEDGNYDNWNGNGVTTWSDGFGVPATNSTYGSPWLTHNGMYMADADSSDDGYLTSDNLDTSSATAIYISFWFMEDDVDSDDSFALQYFNGFSYITIQNLNNLSPVEDIWYQYTAKITDSQYLKNNFRIRFYSGTLDTGEACFIDDVEVNREVAVPSDYQLNLEVQWSNVDYTQSNQVLAIYLGSSTGSDTLAVDIWVGGWHNVFSSLSAGWNNASVSSYLSSSSFTVRFRDSQTNNLVRSTWNIDVALLHSWSGSDQYTAQVEFSGSSTANSWLTFAGNIKSYLDVGSASVTIQFFNYTSGAYMTSGVGYVTYTSSAAPSTSQLQTLSVASDVEDYVDGSGHWKVKVTATKDTATQFNVYFDWIQIDLSYQASAGSIPYGGVQTYTIRSQSANGEPTPYSYVSIYINGTNIALFDVSDSPLANPAWVRLDANGAIQIKLQSTNSTGQTIGIFASVGTTLGEKTITQEAP
ncbi:MAG: hypothetical protein NWE93_03340 [Candidatus Bathyarchaeota archaeon]|nr:hypothetical protein [Candidatus Bathyarchaeota archaeon]